jgi:F-type H+-transporting ATPase subunit a
MTAKAKRITAVGLIVVIAMALAGLATGAIGASLLAGDNGDPKAFLSEPNPHIPPQKIFAASTDSKSSDDHHGEEHHGGGVIEAGDGFVVTNTLLSSWIVSLLLLGLFYKATRRMTMVPTGLQNLLETIIEGLDGFIQGVAGHENARRFFPLIATIFLFVMFNAWVGLLPIWPSLGFPKEVGEGGIFFSGEMDRHILRPAGTDLNMPLALALVSFVFVEFWGFKMLKLSYLGKFIRLENLRRGNFAQVPIDLFVGALELLSEFVRIISFTFRLFGNMTAGEILLIVITYLVPFVMVLPFYGLELLVGMVQALIFAGLTLVFVVVATTPHGEEEH